jgi:RNA polymerase sigma-70 factor (ECF subfamily)
MARGHFDTTRWSVVLRARDHGAEDALAHLCQGYWQPLYAFALRRGHPREAAQDFTQGFFVELLEGRYLEDVREGRGRFRSFLLACFKHYLAHERRKERAAKRGGGATHLSLDFERGIDPPSDRLTPEQAYERQWALTLLDGVVRELEARYRAGGRERLFAALRGELVAGEEGYDPRRAAAELGMTTGAVKVAAHRLRRQYRDALRRRVAETLDAGESVESELDHLVSCL